MTDVRLARLDLLVIGAYAVGMLAVGAYYSRRTKTAEEYLLGGRNMNPIAIGLSLFATLTSTLTYLASPGEMIRHGPMMFSQVAAYPLIALVVGWLLIPFIMRLQVTSAYEILELRLGLSVRLLGSALFLLLRLGWMASILYATSSTVVVPLLGLPREATIHACAVLGLITLVYTATGGLRAVVATDALQSLIMLAGAAVTIVVISVQLGGVGAWWPTEWAAHWDEPKLGYDPAARMTLSGSILYMFIWYVCTAGSDQMAIQRYLATRDARTARRALVTSLSMDVMVIGLLAMVGLALLAYFKTQPMGSGQNLIDGADKLFPVFVVQGLPDGVSGLVIAAMLSAAMSSLSSGMNSSCAVITEDFIARFRRERMSERHHVLAARLVSIGVGAAAVGLSTLVGQVQGNLIDLCFKVVNLLTAPLFLLFFMALFVRWATSFGTVVAAVASVATAVNTAFSQELGWGEISIQWTAPASLLVGVAAGMLASLVPIGPPPRPRLGEGKDVG